jgi:ketosteroid isomerase-like protein
MSEEDVEVVRRWLWAFEHDADVFRDMLHPDVVWFQIEDDRTPSYGIEAAMRSRRQWFETWDEHHLPMEDVIEEGDSVVVAIHITARGKASGVEVDVRFYAQFQVKDGKVVYIYDHENGAAALDAVRLHG